MSVVGGVVSPCDHYFVCAFAGLGDVVVVTYTDYVWSGCEGFRVSGTIRISVEHYHGAVAVASGDVYAFADGVVILLFVGYAGV